MKTFRNSENFKLGLISLFFLSLFLYSNLLKSSIESLSNPIAQNQEKVVLKFHDLNKFSNQTCETTLFGLEESSLEQFNNPEIDFEGLDFPLLQNFNYNFETLTQNLLLSGIPSSLKLISELPLYDLFCNWKFHLI